MFELSVGEKKDQIRNEVQYLAGKIAELEGDDKNADDINEKLDRIRDKFLELLKMGFSKQTELEVYGNHVRGAQAVIEKTTEDGDVNRVRNATIKKRKYEILGLYLKSAELPDPS